MNEEKLAETIKNLTADEVSNFCSRWPNKTCSRCGNVQWKVGLNNQAATAWVTCGVCAITHGLNLGIIAESKISYAANQTKDTVATPTPKKQKSQVVKTKRKKINKEKMEERAKILKAKGVKVAKIAEKLGTSPATVYALLKK